MAGAESAEPGGTEGRLHWTITEEGAQATVKGQTLRFVATNLRTERGKRYASVAIYSETHPLDSDDIALDKREERQRLLNAAYKRMLGSNRTYTNDAAYSDFLSFCDEVWERWAGSFSFVNTRGSEPAPVPWLIQPFAIEKAGTILFAPPGSGKSWLGLAIAITLDAGGTPLFSVTRQANVLYINLERSQESFERRIGSLNQAFGFDRERPLKMIHGRGKNLIDVADMTRRVITKNNIELVVLDSLSRAGQSLVDDTAANKTMDTLNGFGCAWLAIGHTAKNNTEHTFGSQMFVAATDLEIGVEPREVYPQLYQRITMVKSNDVGKYAPIHLVYDMDDYGVQEIRRIAAAEFEALDSNGTVEPLTDEDLAFVSATDHGVTATEFAEWKGISVAKAEERMERTQGIKKAYYGATVVYSVDW